MPTLRLVAPPPSFGTISRPVTPIAAPAALTARSALQTFRSHPLNTTFPVRGLSPERIDRYLEITNVPSRTFYPLSFQEIRTGLNALQFYDLTASPLLAKFAQEQGLTTQEAFNAFQSGRTRLIFRLEAYDYDAPHPDDEHALVLIPTRWNMDDFVFFARLTNLLNWKKLGFLLTGPSHPEVGNQQLKRWSNQAMGMKVLAKTCRDRGEKTFYFPKDRLVPTIIFLRTVHAHYAEWLATDMGPGGDSVILALVEKLERMQRMSPQSVNPAPLKG